MAQDFSQDNIDRWNEEQNKSLFQKVNESIVGVPSPQGGGSSGTWERTPGTPRNDSPFLPPVPDIYGPQSNQAMLAQSRQSNGATGSWPGDVIPVNGSNATSSPSSSPSPSAVSSNQDPYARVPGNERARFFSLYGRDPGSIDRYLKYDSFNPTVTSANQKSNKVTNNPVKRSRASSVLPSQPQEQYVSEGMAPTGLENTTFIHGGDPTTRGMDILPEGWAHLDLNDPSHVNELNRRASLNVLPQTRNPFKRSMVVVLGKLISLGLVVKADGGE